MGSEVKYAVVLFFPQGSHSQILMIGGSNRASYIIPKKITTSEFVYPKKSLLFSIPKNPLVLFSQPKKIPLFFRDPKLLAPFIDPKELLLAKISNPKKSLGTPHHHLSLKYVKWAPGVFPFE